MKLKTYLLILLSFLLAGPIAAQLDSMQTNKAVPAKMFAEKDFSDILRRANKKDNHKILHPNDIMTEMT